MATEEWAEKPETKKAAHPGGLVPMTVRLPPKIQKAVRHAAIEEERLLQNIVTEALVEWLRTHGHYVPD